MKNSLYSKLLIITLVMAIPLILMFTSKKITTISLTLMKTNTMMLNLVFLIDWMTLLFSLTVIIITLFILFFSLTYMNIKEHKRFFLITTLFVLSMIILIFSNNIISLLIGWDGLGLSSYALVIYYQNANSNSSGTITILSNRVGDISLLLTFAILSNNMVWNINMSQNFPLIALTLFSIAAMSKSAQFPFSAWLPAAMAAPTPISALVHSSTLVTAGVYLMIRLSTTPHPSTFSLLLLLATFTALFSSMAANWEQDLKKIIALSTLSQIAIMMFAISINSYPTAFFHLITHALFKSTMFLCAGNIIHNSTYQDTRTTSSMFMKTPLLTSTLGITTLALAGLPFTAGFFSKDAILENLLFKTNNHTLILLMLMAIGMTPSYSLRMLKLSTSFFNKTKSDSMISNLKNLDLPPFMMAPLSLTTGTLLAWITIPDQTLTLSLSTPLSINLALLLGIMTTLMLSFKSKLYLNTGMKALFMWFLHPLTSISALKTLILSPLATKMDLSWHEQTTAQGSFKLQMTLNSIPTKIFKKTTLILMLLMTIPFML